MKTKTKKYKNYKKNTNSKVDVYQEITDKIILDLEGGTVPWVKPWNSSVAFSLPFNHKTGRNYSGINVLMLWMQQSFSAPEWGTFLQYKELGLHIRIGEKGTRILRMETVKVKDKDTSGNTEDDTSEVETFSYARYHSVFSLQQTDFVFPSETFAEQEKDNNLSAKFSVIDKFIKNLPVRIRFIGANSFFDVNRDEVYLPQVKDFSSEESFYSTLLHELIHWSGHESRLNRDLKNTYGSENYAFEELVAEIGSAFICSRFGIRGKLQHASYLQSWLKKLQQDNKYIFKAASLAQKAMEYLLSL